MVRLCPRQDDHPVAHLLAEQDRGPVVVEPADTGPAVCGGEGRGPSRARGRGPVVRAAGLGRDRGCRKQGRAEREDHRPDRPSRHARPSGVHHDRPPSGATPPGPLTASDVMARHSDISIVEWVAETPKASNQLGPVAANPIAVTAIRARTARPLPCGERGGRASRPGWSRRQHRQRARRPPGRRRARRAPRRPPRHRARDRTAGPGCATTATPPTATTESAAAAEQDARPGRRRRQQAGDHDLGSGQGDEEHARGGPLVEVLGHHRGVDDRGTGQRSDQQQPYVVERGRRRRARWSTGARSSSDGSVASLMRPPHMATSQATSTALVSSSQRPTSHTPRTCRTRISCCSRGTQLPVHGAIACMPPWMCGSCRL